MNQDQLKEIQLYIILFSGVIAFFASVYPVPYILSALWKTRTHLVRMFYMLLWVVLILMGFHHIAYFVSVCCGLPLSPAFDLFWICANFFVCLLWLPLYIEVRINHNNNKILT